MKSCRNNVNEILLQKDSLADVAQPFLLHSEFVERRVSRSRNGFGLKRETVAYGSSVDLNFDGSEVVVDS